MGKVTGIREVEPKTSAPTVRAFIHFRRLLTGELLNKALRFLAAAVLARTLSSNEFGLFNIGIAVAGVWATLSSLGLAELGTRKLATEPTAAAWFSGRVLVARLCAFCLVLAVGLAVTQAVWPGNMSFVLGIAAMTFFLVTTGEWVARGLEQMRRVAAGNAIGGGVALAGALILSAENASAAAALGVFAVAELAASAVFWGAASGWRPKLGRSGLRPILRQGAPLALASLAMYGYYANADTIILGITRTPAEAGYYSAAYRLFLLCNIVAIFAAYALFPLSARAEIASARGLARRLQSSLASLALYGGVVVGVAELGGDAALRVLFGSQFEVATEALVLLCIATSWYCAAYPFGYNLIAVGRGRRFFGGAATAGVLAISLDLILIPRYGMNGAAIATLASIVVGAIVWMRLELLTSAAILGRILALLTVSGIAAAAMSDQRRIIGALTALVCGSMLMRRASESLR